jgi:predicted  nucleic acid-binding Zn-ribbon protein
MSFWDTPQTGFGLAPEQVAVGPKLGILGAFERAYKETTQLNSQYGAEMMLRDLEQANRKKIFDAGLVPPPSLEPEEGDTVPKDRIQNPFAHFSTSYYTDYMRTGSAGDRDDKLRKLRAERPDLGIQTYDEMRTKMQEDAQQRRKEAAFPQTYPGAVAGFAGGLVGAFDPRYNPLNVATLGVGGFGENIATRLATEAGAQGALQAVQQGADQFTGVAENRKFLGIPDPTFGERALSVAEAAAGGALFRAGGEAIGAGARGARRWFGNEPHDPAPPLPEPPVRPPEAPPEAPRPLPIDVPPALEMAIRAAGDDPLAATRLGRGRVAADIALAARHLDDWAGPLPRDIPTTDTRLPQSPDITPKMFDPANYTHDFSVDELARKADPEVFRIYDKLVAQREDFKRTVDEFNRLRELELGITKIDNEIDALSERNLRRGAKGQPYLPPREVKKNEARIAELKAQREEILKAQPVDSPGANVARENWVQADNEIRKLQPAVARAYARAEGKWKVYDEQNKAIAQMMAEGRPHLPETPSSLPEKIPDLPPRPQLSTFAPEIVDPRAPNAEGKIPDKDAAETVLRVQGEHVKEYDKAIEDFQKTAGKLAEREQVSPEGTPKTYPGGIKLYRGTSKYEADILRKGTYEWQKGVLGVFVTKDKEGAIGFSKSSDNRALRGEEGALVELQLPKDAKFIKRDSKLYKEFEKKATTTYLQTEKNPKGRSYVDNNKLNKILQEAGYVGVEGKSIQGMHEIQIVDKSVFEDIKPDPNTIAVGDTRLHLDNDFAVIKGEDGQPQKLSIRQLLEQTDDDNMVLQALSSCSVATTL